MSGCHVPGEKLQTGSQLLDLGANMLQGFKPVNQIHKHVCGIHIYDGDVDRQVIAHHYCSHINEEVHQCVIYDSPESTARLIGIEYIISERLFLTLPEEEKKYWHSHAYEVKSGMLVAPSIPYAVENIEMEKLASTYGKTWHTWQVDRGDTLPFGPASLMMAFTRDGQVRPEILAEKDRMTGSITAEVKKNRASIPCPMVHPGADQGFKRAEGKN